MAAMDELDAILLIKADIGVVRNSNLVFLSGTKYTITVVTHNFVVFDHSEMTE